MDTNINISRIPKALIRSLYDLQKQRIQTGNRICAEIKVRLGQAPGESEEVLPAEAKRYLAEMRKEFNRISDVFALTKPSNYLKVEYKEYQVITDAAMLLFAQTYVDQLDNEEHMTKVIAKVVSQHPMWNHFFKDVSGVGPLMTAVCLTEFDIVKGNRIGKFWKYAGLDVAEDGRGRGRFKEHLIDQTYTDKGGKEQTKKGITFNPFLKTKLVGVLASCLIKQVKWTTTTKGVYDATAEDRRKTKKGKDDEVIYCVIDWEGKYRIVYNNYKHRLEHHKLHSEKSKGHRHSMSMRYMTKIFIQDLWLAWRELEGLEVTRPYHEAVLGHNHAS